VEGCCECGDEPLGSGATELVKSSQMLAPFDILIPSCSYGKLKQETGLCVLEIHNFPFLLKKYLFLLLLLRFVYPIYEEVNIDKETLPVRSTVH
jgi:hypothetical protein